MSVTLVPEEWAINGLGNSTAELTIATTALEQRLTFWTTVLAALTGLHFERVCRT